MLSGVMTTMVGEANDYVGKGVAEGDTAIIPPPDCRATPASMALLEAASVSTESRSAYLPCDYCCLFVQARHAFFNIVACLPMA